MGISGRNIRFIFGLKLHQLRIERNLSLSQLSERAGISVSYLNEIEKGKKHPKPDKIIALADALEVKYDELVSLQLSKKLTPVSELIRSNLLEDLPLEFLGIEPGHLLELLSEAPAKFAAFVNSIIRIGRDYDIKVEHFYFSVLRSYQEMHDNYMPEIETAVEEFMEEYAIDPLASDLSDQLSRILTENYNYEIVPGGLSEYPEVSSLRYMVIPGEKNRMLLHPDLQSHQLKFILGREAGYACLKLKKRSFTSSWIGSSQFDEVLNNYKAYYFGSSVITNGRHLIKDIEEIIGDDSFGPGKVLELLTKYECSPEMLFHRLTTLIPHYLRFSEIFFFRYNHDLLRERFTLTKELHGSGIPKQYGADLSEKACSRWSAVQILRKYHAMGNDQPFCEIYRIRYANSTQEYMVISVADTMSPTPNMNYCVSLGFAINHRFMDNVQFLTTKVIEEVKVDYSWIEHSAEFCEDNIEDPEIRQRQLKTLKLREAVQDILANETGGKSDY